MIRRTTAIFFILIANIILLAHAVVPHHHHQEQVCIVNSHCQTDSQAHNHDASEHDHQHDDENSSEPCVLKQAALIPSNSLRQEFKCFGCDNDHSPFDDFQIVLFSNGLKTFVPIFVANAHIQLITSSYTHFAVTSLGLRAPPIV